MKITSAHTYSPEPGDADKKWYVIDATNVVLGCLAAQIATLPRGKHKPMLVPHMDMGDYIIIINADKVALTGKKPDQKMAYCHSGRPGGLTAIIYRNSLAATPGRTVEKAVKDMLPHNSLGRVQLEKLYVYADPEHPHTGQSLVPYELTQVAR